MNLGPFSGQAEWTGWDLSTFRPTIYSSSSSPPSTSSSAILCQFHNPILLFISSFLLFFLILFISLTCQLNNSSFPFIFSFSLLQILFPLFHLSNCFPFNFLLLLLFFHFLFFLSLSFYHILFNLGFLHNHFLLIFCLNGTISEAECSGSERGNASFNSGHRRSRCKAYPSYFHSLRNKLHSPSLTFY